ncbi:MAG: hypothetical protein ACK5KK_05460, partial [Microbacterium sp.]
MRSRTAESPLPRALAFAAAGATVTASLIAFATPAHAAPLPSECVTWDNCRVVLDTTDPDDQALWRLPAGATDIVFTAKGADSGSGTPGGNIQAEPLAHVLAAGDEFVMFVGSAGGASNGDSGGIGGMGAGNGGNAKAPGASVGGSGGGSGAFVFRSNGGGWDPFLIVGGAGGDSPDSVGGGALSLNGGSPAAAGSVRNGGPAGGGTLSAPGAAGVAGTEGNATMGYVGTPPPIVDGISEPYVLAFESAGHGGNGADPRPGYLDGGSGGGGGGSGYYGGGGGGGGDAGSTGQGWAGGAGGGGSAYVDDTRLSYAPADTVPAGADSAIVITFRMAGANVVATDGSGSVGQTATLTADLSCNVDGHTPAAGSVTFSAGGATLATATVAAGATTASADFTPTASGAQTITAAFQATNPADPCSVGDTAF